MKRGRSSAKGVDPIFGVHPVIETLRAGRRQVEELYVTKDFPEDTAAILADARKRIPLKRLDQRAMSSLTGTDYHQGIAAKVGPFPYVDINDLLTGDETNPPPLILLDEIQDPGNLGNIIRLCDCLGAVGVIIPKDRSVPVTPTVEKASAGASAFVPVVRVTNLVRAIEAVKEAGYWLYAAESRAERSIYTAAPAGKVAFVLGSEGKGLRRLVRDSCDYFLSIPMQGNIDSLNVSQAAAVMLGEALRRRSLRD